MIITLFSTLLKKLIIQIATTKSVYEADAITALNHRRSAYIVKVLKASATARAAIKAQLAASDSPGQRQLAAILTIFELLSAEKKADFIIAFQAASSLTGGATPYVAIQTAYQGGQIPPVIPP